MKKSDESTLANKLSVIFQILTRSIFRPKLMRNLIEERNQTKDENKWKKHLYKYDFDSIEEFFLKKFPDVDIKEYEKEIIQLEKKVDVFLCHCSLCVGDCTVHDSDLDLVYRSNDVGQKAIVF